MQLGRVLLDGASTPQRVIIEKKQWFAWEGDDWLHPIRGEQIEGNGRLVAPLQPGKIVCVGLNYLDHVTERDPNRKVPDEPVLFMKPTSSVIGPGDTIEIAHPENQTDYEAELALVVGKTARDVSQEHWQEFIAGFTCANDVSDRTLQKKDGQWVRAKGFHTYCPVGPWIETDLDLGQAVVQSRLNGELRQNQAVSTMLFPIPLLVSYISGIMTLDPGDLILTGTPFNVGPMQPGDTIEVSVSGIGTLSNPVE
ncbi:MAG: fumarylacetoacetate hydrolase family protein [Thermomicrobiales bacterium]|nr:fumarylacetoacetate hydrolase family protein [Thermomicrobiales bacterium]